jgi:type I restriction enzyme S subunit
MEVKPGYKQTEVGVIPDDWELKLLSEVTTQIIDGTHFTPRYTTFGVPFLRVTDIQESEIDFAKLKFISPSEHALLTRRCLPKKGDLLLSKNGTIGIPKIVSWDWECSLFVSLALLKLRSQLISASFLEQFFKSDVLTQQIRKRSKQGTVTNLHLEEIREFRIPLPPTKVEQDAISEALRDTDALLGGLDLVIGKKRDLKQAAMEQLLTGQTRLPGFHGEWEVKRLGTLLRFQVGFPFSSAFFNEKGEGIRLVKNRDLKTDDQVFCYSGKYEDAFVVQNGDVLVGMDGDFLPCRWNKGRALLNQRVGRIVPNAGLNIAFAFYALIKPLKAIEIVTSSTTVKHLSHGDVEGVERPLPELPEQTAIAEVLTVMDAELAGLEQRREKTHALKQAMMQELLTGRTRLV